MTSFQLIFASNDQAVDIKTMLSRWFLATVLKWFWSCSIHFNTYTPYENITFNVLYTGSACQKEYPICVISLDTCTPYVWHQITYFTEGLCRLIGTATHFVDSYSLQCSATNRYLVILQQKILDLHFKTNLLRCLTKYCFFIIPGCENVSANEIHFISNADEAVRRGVYTRWMN